MARAAVAALRTNPAAFASGTISTFGDLFFSPRNSIHFCEGRLGPYLCDPSYSRVRFPPFPNRPLGEYVGAQGLVNWFFTHASLPAGAVTVFMAIGIFAWLRKTAGSKVPGGLLALSVLYFTSLAALFNCAEDRFRLPVDGYLFMFAALGFASLLSGARAAWQRISAPSNSLLDNPGSDAVK